MTKVTYVYDGDECAVAPTARGRLVSVTTGGAVTERYAYDLNGNRTNSISGGAAAYDAQDRLLADVAAAFAYDLFGQLAAVAPNSSILNPPSKRLSYWAAM